MRARLALTTALILLGCGRLFSHTEGDAGVDGGLDAGSADSGPRDGGADSGSAPTPDGGGSDGGASDSGPRGTFDGGVPASCSDAGLVASCSPTGNLTGSVTFPVGQTTTSGPSGLAAGDLDGDGLTDLVVLDGFEGTIAVQRGLGDGGFTQTTVVATGPQPEGLALWDVNGDCQIDALYGQGGKIQVLLGRGDGTFLPGAQGYPIDTGTSGRALGIAIGDLNRDGAPDVVVADSTAKAATVLFNDGDGGLLSPQVYPVGISVRAVAVADLNDDGWPDVVTASEDGNVNPVAGVLINSTQGFLKPAVLVPATGADTPYAIIATDLDGNGTADVAIVGYLNPKVAVLRGDGAGGFGPVGLYSVPNLDPTAPSPVGLAVGDFNADGFPDLAVVNEGDGSAGVMLNDHTAGFPTGSAYRVGTSSQPSPSAICAWSSFAATPSHDLAVTNTTDGPGLNAGSVTLLFDPGCP